MIKPACFKVGDKIAVISPAGSIRDFKTFYDVLEILIMFGLEPVIFPSVFDKNYYLAGTDEARANDVMEAFIESDIKGIICSRGGYGSMRILKRLDLNIIEQNPKIFIGFSDITALHTAFQNKCDFVTFHGPMMSSKCLVENRGCIESFFENLFTEEPVGLYKNINNSDLIPITTGIIEGIITGGNLTMIVSTLGSDYEIDTTDKILFIEEVDEETYRIDRLITSLQLSNKLDNCSGIILGSFTKCDSSDGLSVERFLTNYFGGYKKPVIANFRVGHNYENSTIPLGVRVRLDCDNKEIIFLESGCKK